MIGNGLPYGLHGVLDVLVDASVAMGDRSQAVHYLDQLDAVAMEADLTIAHFRRHHAWARLLGDVRRGPHSAPADRDDTAALPPRPSPN